jgi:hypothetical protein
LRQPPIPPDPHKKTGEDIDEEFDARAVDTRVKAGPLIVADGFDEQPNGSLAGQEKSYAEHGEAHQNRKRQAQETSIPDVGEKRIGEGNDLATGDELGNTPPGDHQDQRRYDRLNVKSADKQSIPSPGNEGHAERGADDYGKRNSFGVDQLGGNRAGDRHNGSH